MLAASATGCGPPECKFRGTINDPANLSMRRAMLRKGMGDFCSQMMKHDAPLRLAPDSPVIGRFYPTQCVAPEGDELHVAFNGFGYAWTNVTKKLTFTTGASALYRYDFIVTESDPCQVYAYFRTSRVDSSEFRVQRIEGGAASVFNAFTSMGESFGRQLVAQKLNEGFTVIHDSEAKTDEFGLGVIQVGKRPFHPYQVHGADKVTYENERVEVHQNQRDFVGPIVVEESGRAIFVSATVDGAPAVDVMFMGKMEGEASLRQYFDVAQAGPLPAGAFAGDVLRAGTELKRAVPVPPGMYYVVFDNTAFAGQVSPPGNAYDDRAAVINYLIQIGDAS